MFLYLFSEKKSPPDSEVESSYYDLNDVARVPSGRISIIRANRSFIVLDVVDILAHFREKNFFKFYQLSETEIENLVAHKESKFSEFLRKLNVNGVSFETIAKYLVLGIQHVGRNGASVKHIILFNNAIKPACYDGDFNEKSNCILCVSLSQTYQSIDFDQILEAFKVHEVKCICFLKLYIIP
jgi:hypothetical protein